MVMVMVMVVGCWLLAVGRWLLVFGCWSLVAGLGLGLPARSRGPKGPQEFKYIHNIERNSQKWINCGSLPATLTALN